MKIMLVLQLDRTDNAPFPYMRQSRMREMETNASADWPASHTESSAT